MTSNLAILLILALVAANLPFVPVQQHIGWRALELVVLYFAIGALGWMLETKLGPVHSQNWEFYAVTGCLFLVQAFPGFVYRYLWRKH